MQQKEGKEDRREVIGLLPQLPEGDGRGGGNVERVDLMRHRDADGIVGIADHLLGQSVALSTQDDSQTRFPFQLGVVDGDRGIGERHRRRTETEGTEAEGAEAPEAPEQPEAQSNAADESEAPSKGVLL